MSENVNSSFAEIYRREIEKTREKVVDQIAQKIVEEGILKPEKKIPENYKGKAILNGEEVQVEGPWGEKYGGKEKIVMEVEGNEQPVFLDQLVTENQERETKAATILRDSLGYESFKEMVETEDNPEASKNQKRKAQEARETLVLAVNKAISEDPELNQQNPLNPEEWKFLPKALEGMQQENRDILVGENLPFKEEVEAIDKLRKAIERAPEGVAKQKAKEVLFDKMGNFYADLITNEDPEDPNVLALEVCYTGEMERMNEELNPPKVEEKVEAKQKQSDNKPRQVVYDSDSVPEKEKKITMEYIYTLLDEIENSGDSTTDLTYNSNKARILREVTEGHIKIMDIPPGKTPEDVYTEIGMREFLNDFFLETSKCHDIQSINKVLAAFHQGDTEHTLDQKFISFFLKDGAGGIPVDKAWDLRQKAYFDYFDINEKGEKKGILVDIVSMHSDLLTKYGISKDDFLNIGIALHKNEKYGIDKDYYMNLRCESNIKRQQVVRDYMVKMIMKGTDCDEKTAKKAVELARKLSVCTFQDSAANIGMVDGDQYAELVLTLFFRYGDSVDTGGEKPGKGKRGVGSFGTIDKFLSLTPPWLALARKEGSPKNLKDYWSQLKASDIDPSKISGKSDMPFHFGSIVEKQVMVFKDMIFKPSDPKNTNFDLLEDSYSRINKAVSEAYGVGWPILSEKFSSDEKMDIIQRKTRFWIIAGIIETATREGSSWNWESMEGLLDWLVAPNFPDQDGNKTISYISKAQRNWIEKAYGVERILKAREWKGIMKKTAKLKL